MSPMEIMKVKKNVTKVSDPKQTWVEHNVGIVSTSTSFYHTLCADKLGGCYSWGGGQNGQLGYDKKDNQLVPRALIFSSTIKIVQVAAGKFHSLARTQNGDVFAWGKFKDGRLGLGLKNEVNGIINGIVYVVGRK